MTSRSGSTAVYGSNLLPSRIDAFSHVDEHVVLAVGGQAAADLGEPVADEVAHDVALGDREGEADDVRGRRHGGDLVARRARRRRRGEQRLHRHVAGGGDRGAGADVGLDGRVVVADRVGELDGDRRRRRRPGPRSRPRRDRRRRRRRRRRASCRRARAPVMYALATGSLLASAFASPIENDRSGADGGLATSPRRRGSSRARRPGRRRRCRCSAADVGDRLAADGGSGGAVEHGSAEAAGAAPQRRGRRGGRGLLERRRCRTPTITASVTVSRVGALIVDVGVRPGAAAEQPDAHAAACRSSAVYSPSAVDRQRRRRHLAPLRRSTRRSATACRRRSWRSGRRRGRDRERAGAAVGRGARVVVRVRR